MHFERAALSEVPWQDLDRLPDRVVFQSQRWLRFLETTQRGEPVVAVGKDSDGTLAYLTGAIVRRYGLRIFGAPLKGWSTISMGFNRLRPVDDHVLLDAAIRFAFRGLRCRHFEMVDPTLRIERSSFQGGVIQTWNTWTIDLTQTEDKLFGNLSSACRRAIRKSRREVTIERAYDDGFVDDYYDQLRHVFARRSLAPTYSRHRVEALLRKMLPAEDLLLLRALGPGGKCIATGIFPGNGQQACFWGGASWRQELIHRPNEALMWHAMLHWKARGARTFDLGGGAAYKRKFGGQLTPVPRVLSSRPAGILRLRQIVAGAFRYRQRLLGHLARDLRRGAS